MTLKAKLKTKHFDKLLIKLNLSANEFSRKCGISSGYMSQIMSHKRLPSGKVRQKIIDYLNQIGTIYVRRGEWKTFKFDDLFEIEDG